jgi:hypothetical protein
MNALIAAAPADVAGHGVVDLLVGRGRRFGEQRRNKSVRQHLVFRSGLLDRCGFMPPHGQGEAITEGKVQRRKR